jgi:lipopolysaccharide transport system ATP-binding protein
MALDLRDVFEDSPETISFAVPDGAVIGIVGENGSGIEDVLAEASKSANTLVLYNSDIAVRDAIERAELRAQLAGFKRSGHVALIGTHDESFLASCADEIWWIHEHKLIGKGDPAEILARYGRHVITKLRALNSHKQQPMAPSMRRGDGRAEIIAIETLGAEGRRPTMRWTSGEQVAIRVEVRFAAAVEDPVVGIMIRTRIGFEVYGTNTELEKVKLGPCAAGETRRVLFEFRCELCPQEYTVTAASHDPDGIWHDWLEDAVAFTVADSRYTAGVANLRATVRLES